MGVVGDLANSKPVESLTNFFAEIVGKPLVDGAGMLYVDAIRTKRIANTLKLEEKYKIVKSAETQPTTLAFGYKLLEKASLEEDESILEKWANLLGNATDRDFNGTVRKIFVDILDTLEPFDVKIFDEMNRFCLNSLVKYNTLMAFNKTPEAHRESLNVLLSQGLITYGVTTTKGMKIGGFNHTTFHGLDNFKITELGQSFYQAVSRQPQT